FSVTLLAAGLEQDRLTLLRSLKRIEDDFHLIIDVETTDDIMSLESQTLRRVLRENSKYINNSSNKKELYKEMHFKIAQKMIENEDSFAPLEIMNHCILSGDRLAKESIKYGTQAIESASKKFSWKTVSNIVNKLENLGLLKYADPETKDKIIFYKVKSLRGIGNDDVYTLSMDLEKLLHSNNLGSYEVLYTYLENLYNDRFNKYETPTCQYLIEKINNFKSESFYENLLIKSLITFYEILAVDFINDKQSIESLEKLIDQIKQIDIESAQKNIKDALLSIVMQHTANTLAFSKLDNIHEKVITMFDESLAIKKSIGDLQGIAINLGSRGRYNLFEVKNYKEATKYFIEDLEYMEKMGDEAARPGILNQTAMSYWGQAQESTNEDEKKQYQTEAYKLANESFDLSEQLNQTMNQARAGNNLLEYFTEMGDMKMINEYGQRLNDPNIWEKMPNNIAN
ncbi:MAG: hypothetical protein QF864_14885, partial [SAR202 cluster bacterium]|nr:hypothetical protein [SAR202 cluster bacterium]